MRYLTLFLTFLFLPLSSLAQDTLHVGTELRTDQLEVNNTKSYLHYREMKDGTKVPFSIKEIALEKEGNMLTITQTENSGEQSWTIQTIVDASTLITDTHIRESAEKRESYQFGKDAITGLPDDEPSDNKDFNIDLEEPTFNFEIDFIFLQSINWAEHDSVVLNFYHPGGSLPPAYYTFAKEKEETLSLTNGIIVDTWVIFTDYNGQSPARFWLTKDTNEIIKQESDLMARAGFNFVKQLIPGA